MSTSLEDQIEYDTGICHPTCKGTIPSPPIPLPLYPSP